MSNRLERSQLVQAPEIKLAQHVGQIETALADSDDSRATERVGNNVALLYGGVVALIGASAIFVPKVSEIALDILAGAVLIGSGFARLSFLPPLRATSAFWFSALTGSVAIVLGALLIAHPLPQLLTLALILTFYLVYQSTAAFGMALEALERGEAPFWPVLHGAVDLVLAGLISIGMVGPGFEPLVFSIGVSLAVGGLCLMMLGRPRVDRSIRKHW